MGVSSGQVQAAITYSIAPIILTGGIATAQGGSVPIVTLTDLVTADNIAGLGQDDYFAYYVPLPGATMVNNAVATYPFANQSVAANAIIAQPLNISMLMRCPAKSFGSKQTTMIALQNSLAQHNSIGGTYTVVTFAYIYTACIMTAMRDVSGGGSKQFQYEWQLDFLQPLVTIAAAQQAQNSLTQKLTDGTAQSASATLSSALGTTSTSQAQLTGSLTSGLQTSLNAAGISTSGEFGPAVASTVGYGLTSGFSASDLSGALTSGLIPLAANFGVGPAALQGIVSGSVTNTLTGLGLGPAVLQQQITTGLGAPFAPGSTGLSVGNPLNLLGGL